MHIQSKIQLQYNDGVTGTRTSKVIGMVENILRNGDCTYLGANFTYGDLEDVTPDGYRQIMKDSFELNSAEEIQELYDAIKDSLPSTDDEPLYERSKIYEAFRLEMVQTFLPMNPALTIADIELIQ